MLHMCKEDIGDATAIEAAMRMLFGWNLVKVVRKGDRLLIPMGRSVELGPFETKRVILPFRIIGTYLQNILAVSEIPKLMVSIAYRNNVDVVLHLQNVGVQARMINEKATLVGIQLFLGAFVTWDTSINETQKCNASKIPRVVFGDISHWKTKYTAVFDDKATYEQCEAPSLFRVT